MSRKLLYVGAPSAKSLDWNKINLLNDFDPLIRKFISRDDSSDDLLEEEDTIPSTHPPWRSLPLNRQHLTTGFTQSFDQHLIYNGHSPNEATSFFVTSQVYSLVEELSQQLPSQDLVVNSAEKVLSQFYEESYARHEDIISSQLAPASNLDFTNSYSSDESTDLSYDTTSFGSLPGGTPTIPTSGHLNNIKDIPNAGYLNSIQPQTMTLNLIVGIISIEPSRSIRTKRGADVELIEVLVGDDTKTGFGINFWISSTTNSVMKSALSGLRPQDVVLLRNVALSSFKGKVYGQSLRKEMTKVHLLYRRRIDKTDLGGCYTAADLDSVAGGNAQLEKTKRVREWVMKFVGVGVLGKRKRGANEAPLVARKEILPPDTQ